MTTLTAAQPTPFARRLKRLREESGLSQRQLASTKVSYAYISRLEHGTRRPSMRAIRSLAKKLGVNPVYLETGQMLTCPYCGGKPKEKSA